MISVQSIEIHAVSRKTGCEEQIAYLDDRGRWADPWGGVFTASDEGAFTSILAGDVPSTLILGEGRSQQILDRPRAKVTL